MSETKAIEIRGLKKTYDDGTEALKGIDLTVEAGEFFALLGANGAGKTTIIGIMTSLVNKTEGSVKVYGYDLDDETALLKQQIGVVPQEFNFNFFEKVFNIVVQQAGYFGMARGEAVERAEEVLKALELWDKKDTVSMSLSGGMKRRLMIARALMHRPKLLILDEPTAGVDVELRHGMWKYLNKLNAEGTTILLTTHYLEEVEELCEKVAMIKDGVIIKQDTVKNAMRSVESQTYEIDVDKVDANFSVAGYETKVVDENTIEIVVPQNKPVGDLICDLKNQGVTVNDLNTKGSRMEQLFLNLLNS